MDSLQKILVMELPIRLGQFLKLANLVQDGFEATTVILEGKVLVNDLVEKRRGKKLCSGDKVTFAGKTLIVATDEENLQQMKSLLPRG